MQNEFGAFSDPIQTCEELHSHVTVKTYPAKTVIVDEGQKQNCVYFILEGEVKITSFSPQGNEVWHNAHGAGWTVGEMAAISGKPRSASVTTTKKTKLAVISRFHFLNLLHNYPEISMIFLKDMVRRLGIATRVTHEVVSMKAATRLAAELIRRTKDSPDTNGEYLVPDRLSVTDLAQQLNIRRETISKIISIYVQEGILRRENRTFIVINKMALLEKIEE